MGEAGRDEAVLDLSAWPQQPPAPPRRASLPPRPVRRRRLPSVGLGRLAAAVLALAAVLLAVPLPGTGCPSALAVWAADPARPPSATPPALDDAAVTADTAAVDRATKALAAQDAEVAEARRLLAQPAATTLVHRTVAAPGDVSGLERAVRTDTAARDQAKAALDRLVEQQQTADDPAAYDADVAAAQEDLDVAEARLADDQQALAAARRATATVTTSVPRASSDRAAAQAVVDQAPAVRAGLAQQLTRARQAQAQHLAQRRSALSAWSARHAQDVARVEASNAHLAACGGRVRPAGGAGGVLAVAGAGLLVLRRRRV